MPRTSILMANYNKGKHIAEAIQSVLNQTFKNWELIIIDDCSTDGTGEIASKMGVKVIRPPQNTGSKAKSQNYALPYVNTDLIIAIERAR